MMSAAGLEGVRACRLQPLSGSRLLILQPCFQLPQCRVKTADITYTYGCMQPRARRVRHGRTCGQPCTSMSLGPSTQRDSVPVGDRYPTADVEHRASQRGQRTEDEDDVGDHGVSWQGAVVSRTSIEVQAPEHGDSRRPISDHINLRMKAQHIRNKGIASEREHLRLR